MLKDTDENAHQITLEEYFDQNIKPDLFAVSRVFAEARKQMTLSEYKAFTLALCSIRWKEPCPEVLYIDKKTAAHLVGVHSDSDHLSQDLKRSIGELPVHSFLQFSDKDSGTWVNGCFVVSVGFFKNRIRIRMNPDYLSLFGNLDTGYITMWSADIYKMHSERAIKFYELLRENSDTRLDVNIAEIGIRRFKELFDIPKEGEGSYMRSEKNGGFNRAGFERYVIDPVCDDLAHTEMIKLIVQSNGKYYEKIKKNGRVTGYRFFWTISQHPGVASAEEVHQLQERVDKNPTVLKVAKDLVSGKKKPKKKDKAGYNNFDQRKYDYDELERKLANCPNN